MFNRLFSRNGALRKSQLPSRKRWLFRVLTMVLVFGMTELLSWGGLKIVREDATIADFHMLQSDITRSAIFNEKPSEAIHPYLGYVLNPEQNVTWRVGNQAYPVNELGFADREFRHLRRAEDRVIIAILGGSVAWQMSALGEKRFRQTLAADPGFAGKEIVLVRLALSGYKQPQQLMALNYLLALGAEFDYVVNVDGYNEIALPAAENYGQGVSVAYPRAWHVLMINVVDPRESELVYRVLETKAQRQRLARAAIESYLNWSCTYNLVWYIRDRSLQNSLRELTTQYRRDEEYQGRGFQSDGPDNPYQSDDEMLAALTEIWRNSSLQLHRLCEANGAVYIHVLQPNQYLPGSKPLTPIEQAHFVDPRQEYGKAVARGYPLLMAAGRELRSTGIRFYDETMLFAETDGQIYADCFCHYNQRGNDMLADRVARLVIVADNEP